MPQVTISFSHYLVVTSGYISYIYIYIYIYMSVYFDVYIYIYTEREREREREKIDYKQNERFIEKLS